MSAQKITVARYRVDGCFKITGRGLVMAGELLEGNFKINDFIEFTAFNEKRYRKIKAIEMIRFTKPNPRMVGILLEPANEIEIEELCNWKPQGDEGLASIYHENF